MARVSTITTAKYLKILIKLVSGENIHDLITTALCVFRVVVDHLIELVVLLDSKNIAIPFELKSSSNGGVSTKFVSKDTSEKNVNCETFLTVLTFT